MFCPRCAQQNSDDAKFCRACGENLKVIGQAMTRRLPVVLAGKLDEYLERRNERLRRDSFLYHLIGFVFLITGIWEPLMLPAAFTMFGFGTWNMLAYRRSISLELKTGKRTTAPLLKTVYCPRCGESNNADTKFCRKCAENLARVAQAMRRRLPAFITNKLDQYVERKNERILRESIGTAVLGIFSLLFGTFMLTVGGINTTSVLSALPSVLAACLCFTMSAWDMLVYKRSLSSAPASADLPAATDTCELLSHTALPTEPPSVTESTTKLLDQPVERSKTKE